MERVVADDLPIGFCDSTGDVAFWRELRKDADWLSGADVYYSNGVLDVSPMPADVERETVQDEIDNQFRSW